MSSFNYIKQLGKERLSWENEIIAKLKVASVISFLIKKEKKNQGLTD